MISPISNFRVLPPSHDLARSQDRVGEILKRLSTGRRINSGRDDPAGLIASERLEAEIRSLEAESRALARADANANIADGRTAQLSSIYREIDSLVLRAGNAGAISAEERDAYQLEIDGLSAAAQRIADGVLSSYDGVNLPGTGNAELATAISDARAAVANVTSGGPHDLASGNLELARAELASASTAIASARGRIGAYQRYDVLPRITANRVAIENLTASRSRIADADFAVETSLLAQAQVIETANLKTLSMVHQLSGNVLDLIS